MQRLPDSPNAENLPRAVAMLTRARLIHLVGVRRSFPVAAYLASALNHAGCKAHLLNGFAGMFAEQVQLMEPSDVLIAISAQPYASETLAVAEAAARGHIPLIALTDSPVSPVARLAQVCLVVREAELQGLRSLTANLCLAQTLVAELARQRSARNPPGEAAGGA